jgi:hypothetical protein
VSRIALRILIGLVCFGPANDAAGQARKIDSPEVLKQLLAGPAPTPRHAGTPAPPDVVDERPPEFYYRNNVPPEDAPVEDLIMYWARWANGDRVPSESVQKRLLDACISDPQMLPAFLNLLPDTASTATKIKNVFDKAQNDPAFDPSWHEKVRKWLLFNSNYFLDELIAMAAKAKENVKDGDVDKEDALVALANVSWTSAEPFLRGLMASGQPRSMALALSLNYEHAVEEKDLGNEERYRRELQAIASNRNQPGYARDTAIVSLSSTEWSGRDDWYLGLFEDETLLDLIDGDDGLTPLTTLFDSDPEKWIPIMVRLIESRDINVRSAAAACLVRVDDEEGGKKALPPLLPWLINPEWVNDPSNNRLTLIRILGPINIPESVPGLIAVLESEEAERPITRGYAAESLSLYQDVRAIAAIKRALTKEKEDSQRYRFVKALLASNGVSEGEQLEALEAYATKLTEPDGRIEMIGYRTQDKEPLPFPLLIGRYLAQSRETPSGSLISAVLARAEELRSENPAVTNALLEIAHTWNGQQVELDMIRRIGNGSADSATILEALRRKDKMQQGLRVELQGLASVAGAAQGVGAVLLNDPTLAQGILTSEDEPAQIALLACSRLTQTPLPVELIGPFLRHKNPLLALAAENYLLAEDSREAQDLLWQRHPNEAFVTGWREDLVYGGNSYEAIVKGEEKARAEVLKENGPVEILAFLNDVMDQGVFLKIYPDKAVLTEYEDAARYRERTIPRAEVAALKDYLATRGFLERGPNIEWCHHGCPTSQLLMVTKEKGRRVFNRSGFPDWSELREQFSLLASGEGAKIHYRLEQEIKGLEVLYAGGLAVNDVAQQGGELRILVERQHTPEENEEWSASYNVHDEDDEELQLTLSKRRVELMNARYSWRVFANGAVGATTSPPDFYSTFDATRFMVADENVPNWEHSYDSQTQVLTSDSVIIARNFDGLWRQFAGARPVRLGTENAGYTNAIVTGDGKWVIVTKNEENEPDFLVRLNLQTGREFPINLPSADELKAITFLPSLGKALVRRDKGQYVPTGRTAKGPDRPEYYLVDPSTGTSRLVTGNFTPLYEEGKRFLQPADKPDEFWATMSDEKKNETQIGRYSVRDFSFKPVMTVPQLIFNSKSMWVDAGQRKVYVAYKGQLLRLPLQSTAK